LDEPTAAAGRVWSRLGWSARVLPSWAVVVRTAHRRNGSDQETRSPLGVGACPVPGRGWPAMRRRDAPVPAVRRVNLAYMDGAGYAVPVSLCLVRLHCRLTRRID